MLQNIGKMLINLIVLLLEAVNFTLKNEVFQHALIHFKNCFSSVNCFRSGTCGISGAGCALLRNPQSCAFVACLLLALCHPLETFFATFSFNLHLNDDFINYLIFFYLLSV